MRREPKQAQGRVVPVCSAVPCRFRSTRFVHDKREESSLVEDSHTRGEARHCKSLSEQTFSSSSLEESAERFGTLSGPFIAAVRCGRLDPPKRRNAVVNQLGGVWRPQFIVKRPPPPPTPKLRQPFQSKYLSSIDWRGSSFFLLWWM